MVTRTFNKYTYTLKGIDANDEMKTLQFEAWEHELPNGKRALNAIFAQRCKDNGLELFKATQTGVSSEVRGVSEADFFRMSERVER